MTLGEECADLLAPELDRTTDARDTAWLKRHIAQLRKYGDNLLYVQTATIDLQAIFGSNTALVAKLAHIQKRATSQMTDADRRLRSDVEIAQDALQVDLDSGEPIPGIEKIRDTPQYHALEQTHGRIVTAWETASEPITQSMLKATYVVAERTAAHLAAAHPSEGAAILHQNFKILLQWASD